MVTQRKGVILLLGCGHWYAALDVHVGNANCTQCITLKKKKKKEKKERKRGLYRERGWKKVDLIKIVCV